jgi:DNA repair ATPase RecN
MTDLTLETISTLLDTKFAPLYAEIETIKIQISGLPLVAQSLHEIREDSRQIRQELRMLRAAINDMARINITGGEVEAIHTDLQRIDFDLLDLKTRIANLEEKL